MSGMTTPTLAERLAEIAQLIRDADVRDPNFREAMIWMHRILTRLGDADVIEAAAREIDPIAWLDTPLTAEQDIARAGYRKQSLTDARAALSASAAMAMEES